MRINPFEVHIDDVDFYDELYVAGSTRRTMKYGWAMKMFGRSTAALATESHELHRIRRAALAPFLSKASVQQLEPTVQSIVDNLTSRLRSLQGSGIPVNLVHAFTSLTGDIIGQYTFDQSYGLIDRPDFAPQWYQTWVQIAENLYAFQHFAWLEPLIKSMPTWLVNIVDPKIMSLVKMQDVFRDLALTEVDVTLLIICRLCAIKFLK